MAKHSFEGYNVIVLIDRRQQNLTPPRRISKEEKINANVSWQSEIYHHPYVEFFIAIKYLITNPWLLAFQIH